MTLLTAESITNGLKSRLGKIWGRKMEFSKTSDIVECIHTVVEKVTFVEVSYDFCLVWAVLLVFCWIFGFISVLV